MKIGSFISSIVTIILGSIVSIVCYQLVQSCSGLTGVGQLSSIVLVPVGIILLIVACCLSISSFISSILALTSALKAIKIISILLLILSLGLLVFTTFDVIWFIQIF